MAKIFADGRHASYTAVTEDQFTTEVYSEPTFIFSVYVDRTQWEIEYFVPGSNIAFARAVALMGLQSRLPILSHYVRLKGDGE